MSVDSSSEMALTLVRGLLVVAVAGALACLTASTQLPFFTLRMEALHSSIEQTLWHTHVRTPLGDKEVRVIDFWKCDELVNAFKGAQAATFLAGVFATTAFLFSIFNVASFFGRTVQRVRWVCGAPLIFFMFLALLGQLITLALANAMYTRDWCQSMDDNSTSLRGRTDAMPGRHAQDLSEDNCDPFDGCVRSFKEMGFDFSNGHSAACAASIMLSVGILCELLVCAFAPVDDDGENGFGDYARVGEPSVTLLGAEGRPNNGEVRGLSDAPADHLV